MLWPFEAFLWALPPRNFIKHQKILQPTTSSALRPNIPLNVRGKKCDNNQWHVFLMGLVYLFRLVWSFSLPYIHSFTASCNYLKLPNRWMEFGSTHRRQRALIQHVPFHVLLVFQPIGRKFSSPPRFLSTSTRLETCITTITPPDQRWEIQYSTIYATCVDPACKYAAAGKEIK